MIERVKVAAEQTLLTFAEFANKLISFVNKKPDSAGKLEWKEIFAYLSLYFGLAVNLFFGTVKFVMGILFASSWLISVGIYYILLGSMRFMLLLRERGSSVREGELEFRRYQVKGYLFCGLMMLFLNIIITVFGVPMVYSNPDKDYPPLFMSTFIIFAAYNFIVAVVNLIRFFGIRNPILSAAKRINLVTALVSIFSLQSAIFTYYGDIIPWPLELLLNSITGSFVGFVILVIAITMIGHSIRELHKLNKI